MRSNDNFYIQALESTLPLLNVIEFLENFTANHEDPRVIDFSILSTLSLSQYVSVSVSEA